MASSIVRAKEVTEINMAQVLPKSARPDVRAGPMLPSRCGMQKTRRLTEGTPCTGPPPEVRADAAARAAAGGCCGEASVLCAAGLANTVAAELLPCGALDPAVQCNDDRKRGRSAGASPAAPAVVARCAAALAIGRRTVAQRLEARLYGLLQRLPSASRREALARYLSQAERLALERWILRERLAEHSAIHVGKLLLQRKGRRQKCRVGFALALGAEKHTGRRPKSGIEGVYARLKCGRLTYASCVQVGCFKVDTSYFEELPRLQAYRQVLLAIQTRLRRALLSAHSVQKDLVRTALLEEPLRFGYQAAEMGLRFTIVVPAKLWVGTTLRTPQFSVPSELETGLEAWSSLARARDVVFRGRSNRHTFLAHHTAKELQAAWRQLRDVYLDLWPEVGRLRTRVDARLRTLEEKHRHRCREILDMSLAAPAVVADTTDVQRSFVRRGTARACALDGHIVRLVSRWRCRQCRPGPAGMNGGGRERRKR